MLGSLVQPENLIENQVEVRVQRKIFRAIRVRDSLMQTHHRRKQILFHFIFNYFISMNFMSHLVNMRISYVFFSKLKLQNVRQSCGKINSNWDFFVTSPIIPSCINAHQIEYIKNKFHTRYNIVNDDPRLNRVCIAFNIYTSSHCGPRLRLLSKYATLSFVPISAHHASQKHA